MRTQRKIYHLLADNGIIGKGFAYLPKLSSRHFFDWSSPITVTDKIDGTTVQATNSEIFKRYDNFKSGDTRKFTANEEERYYLKVLSRLEPENKWIFEAYDRYVELLTSVPDGLTLYFECFGGKINQRYRGRTHDIRVFDFAQNDEYLPFAETLNLCEQLKLPVVGNVSRKFDGVKEIISMLVDAEHEDLDLKEYELEGWVLRQNDQIAKIRKEDIKKIEIEEK